MTEEEFIAQHQAGGNAPLDVPPVEVTAPRITEEEFLKDYAPVDAKGKSVLEPKAKVDLTNFKYGPITGAAIRGAAGAPGMFSDIANFLTDIPGLALKGAGATSKWWNNTDQSVLSDYGNQYLENFGNKIPLGSDWWKDVFNAPKEGIDYGVEEAGFPRVFQKGVEMGAGSFGPGLLGLGAKAAGITKLPQFIAPTAGPAGKQLALDTTSGTFAGAGQQQGEEWGGEEWGGPMGAAGGIGGGALIPLLAGTRRVGAGVMGVREPSKFTEHPGGWLLDLLFPPGGENEAKARLNENLAAIHPNAREQLLAELTHANARARARFPNIDFTPGMLTDNPAMDILTAAANKQSGTLVRDAANTARGELRGEWQGTSPGGDVTLPKALVSQRVDDVVAKLAQQRQAAEANRIVAETATGQPAQALGAAGADASAAAENLHANVVGAAKQAQKAAGADIEAATQLGAKVLGNALETWRKGLIKEADDQGQKSLVPDFLNAKEGGLNEELYPTTATGVQAAPGKVSGPSSKVIAKDISLSKVIGWDQLLREEATQARAAGKPRAAYWADQARAKLNSLIEGSIGSDQYTLAKKRYFDEVVQRFYTPTVDPLLAPDAIAGTTKALGRTKDTGRQAVRDMLLAVGDDPQAGKAFVDATLADFASVAYNPQTRKLDANKAQSWIKAHAPAIAELRYQGTNGNQVAQQLSTAVTSTLDNAMSNQSALDAALQTALAREKAAGSRETQWAQSLQNKSAARFFLGRDPEATVTSLLNSKNLSEDAASVGRLLAKDADAQKGFQQAVYDHMYETASGITAKLDPKDMRSITAQITDMLAPYQKLEDAGALAKGTVKRARQLIAAEYTINRGERGASAPSIAGVSDSEKDISQISRGLAGSRIGNLVTATVRDLFKISESELVHKVLREAALDPAKMTELLTARSVGKVNLKQVFLRQAAEAGYKGTQQ